MTWFIKIHFKHNAELAW